MLLDLLQADSESFLLFLPVGSLLLRILLAGNPDHRLQGLNHLIVLHLHDAAHNRSVFHTPGSLHDDVVILFYVKLQRIKKINLARCAKSNPDNFNHCFTSLAPDAPSHTELPAAVLGYFIIFLSKRP